MNIIEASAFFKGLLNETYNKREIKVYKNFMAILLNLKNRNLTEEQLLLVEDKIRTLNLKSNPENRKRYFSKKLNEFKKYLKDEFSLISEGYYKAIGIGIGMSFGVAIGSSFGGSNGVAFGISIGMLIGLIIGRNKDAEAEKENRVLKTKIN
jgi:hypothetical protein